MPAESIRAAHSVLTEISAHPVSKSSLAERLHHPTPTQKRPPAGWARRIRQKLVAAMSVEGLGRVKTALGCRPLAARVRVCFRPQSRRIGGLTQKWRSRPVRQMILPRQRRNSRHPSEVAGSFDWLTTLAR